MGPGRMDARIERGQFTAHGFKREAERDIRILQDVARIPPREHADGERDGGAVDEGGRIFGTQWEIRIEPRLLDRVSRGHALAFVDDLRFRKTTERTGHMGQRRKIARRTDRSLHRNDGM